MDKKRATGSAGERLLRVLRAVVDADDAVALPEITDMVDLPKPTVHRLLTLLEDEGFLARDADARRYLPGPALYRMTHGVLRSRAQQARRHAILEQVSGLAEEACNLVILDGNCITYIDRVDASWPLSIHLAVGSRLPLHCTATGKLLLSLQPKRVRDRLLDSMSLEALTPHTITGRAALEKELERIRREQLGTDVQEFIEGMTALAVPIPTPSGAPVSAISLHAPIFRTSLDKLHGYVPHLRDAARELARITYG